MRLNAVAGEYDGIYTSHVRNRDSGILDAIDEFLAVARAGGTRAEISHLNVRHNTNAPERGWERAVEMMAAARETGHGRPRRHDAVPRRPRPDGRDPAAVGRRRRPGGRRSRSCATRRLRERLRTECDRYWRFIHKGEWERVRLQASAAASRARTGSRSRQIAERLGKATRGTATSTSSPTPAPPTRAILIVGTLFTDEHLAEMISHPLFCLGVDTFTVTDERAARATSCGTRSASPATSTTSPTTCASKARCASRRRSGR